MYVWTITPRFAIDRVAIFLIKSRQFFELNYAWDPYLLNLENLIPMILLAFLGVIKKYLIKKFLEFTEPPSVKFVNSKHAIHKIFTTTIIMIAIVVMIFVCANRAAAVDKKGVAVL